MTVYVDDRQAPGRELLWAHIIADTQHELHAFAARLGITAKRLDGAYAYAVTPTERLRALAYGARAVTLRQCACMAANQSDGYPMGTPETAEAIRRAWQAQKTAGRPGATSVRVRRACSSTGMQAKGAPDAQ